MPFNSTGENTVVVKFNGMILESAQLNEDPLIQAPELKGIIGDGDQDVPGPDQGELVVPGPDQGGRRRKKSAKRGGKPKRKKTARRK
jgi:hypothetical protein